MKLSPELEEICTCNNLDHTILNYYCPANGNEDEDLVGEWAGFNPYEDTCLGCGGQKTPEWPGYGPDGPENGNCAQELPECDLNLGWLSWREQIGAPCPVCGDYTLYSDAPQNAPDFLCRDCHDEKMSDDDEWREQTLERKSAEVDYEDIEDQAVMFDVLNMVEANDLWNELMFELITRGDAIRRPDGKIIFTDQAPGYDIIEDIAEYTSPQFEFNADGDIK